MIRVLLVDDDALVRAGLRLMLSGAGDVEVVAEAADGAEAVALVARHRPDVVLMDVRMPVMDGLAATRELRRHGERPVIVMLTTFTADDYVLRALRAGADGYLLKHTPPDGIVAAVRGAAAGEPVLSPAAARRLIDAVSDGRHEAAREAAERAGAALLRLGAREREVAEAIGRGMTNAEIAAELYMSVPTVKTHVSHVLTKLGLTNRVQIALTVHGAGGREPGA